MQNSEVVRPRSPVTVRRLLLLMVVIIVGSASPPTFLRQPDPNPSPTPPTSSTRTTTTFTTIRGQLDLNPSSKALANSTPSIDYAPRNYSDSQLSPTQPAEAQMGLAHTMVQSQLVAPSFFPEVIRVGRTSNPGRCVTPPRNVLRVDHVPFKEYVRNVLPYEWYSTWPEASLDAGVVAVSQFAWVTILQRKWTRFGHAFDVLDSTCDQVYRDRNPNLNYSRTDAAVERMWGVTLTRNGQLFPTYYRAHSRLCGQNCLGQRESRDLALSGWSAVDILQHFYGPSEVNNWPGANTGVVQLAPAPAPASGELVNVGRTFDPSNCFPRPRNVQRIDRVPLKDYARNVLPYITNNSWSDAALDASVASIIQYIQATKAERKWTKFGHGFDVVDSTCDYPYLDRQAGWDYSRTDAAVNRVIP